jgi:hypothetical protein
MRILAVILCIFLCFGCQSASRQLMEAASTPELTAAPPVQTIQAVPETQTSPVLAEQDTSPTSNDCFGAAFDFMDYWGKTEATTQMHISVEQGGAVKSSLGYSGSFLF